jgi:hypothetical protein
VTTTRNRRLYELAIGAHGFRRIADSEIENSFALGRDGVYIVSEHWIYRYGLGYADPADPDANAQTRPGFARVDIGRDGHGCHRVWQTDSLAAPSVVPKLSLKTVPTGEGTLDNNNYASLSPGPTGNAYLTTIGGITELRRR